jgi:hypothetical protein
LAKRKLNALRITLTEGSDMAAELTMNLDAFIFPSSVKTGRDHRRLFALNIEQCQNMSFTIAH